MYLKRVKYSLFRATASIASNTSLEALQADLDAWLVEYNENRTRSGKYCFGKTPMQTFKDSIPLAKEKVLHLRLQSNQCMEVSDEI